MLSRLKKQNLGILAYAIAWLSPAIILVAVQPEIASFIKLILAIGFGIVWHLAFKSYLRSVYWSLFFFMLLPFDLFFFWIYREPPTTAVLLSVRNTNIGETIDFMHGRIILLLGIVAATIGIWLQTARLAQQGVGSGWRIYNPVTRWASRSVMVFLLSVYALFTFGMSLRSDDSPLGSQNSPITIADNAISSSLVKLKGIFPLGRFVSLGEFYRQEAIFRHAQQWRNKVPFNAKQNEVPQQRQIYILVIGETARGDHSYLNGYSRDTSPFLSKQNNLIALHNVISPWSMTRLSVPTIVTGQQSADNGAQLKSIVSAFKESGFKTYWLSNQQDEYGIGYFASEADEKIYLSMSALVQERDGNYDERVLAPLQKLIDRKEPRQFIVVHLLGSHDAYQKRYPQSFDAFQPSLTSKPDLDYHDARNKAEVVNTYDNSMRYTDFVLSNIIEITNKAGGVSALFYSSDHGETLFDGACQRSGHASSARQEFAVNAIAWVSDEHRKHWPHKYQYMNDRAATPLTTEFIFDTLLGLANITINKASPQHDLTGPGFQPQERWVNAQQLTNWDTAGTKGPCNLLRATSQQ
jgi:glucan phosphoethanolaminetransferase (alkaline phosphatase superfamily)